MQKNCGPDFRNFYIEIFWPIFKIWNSSSGRANYAGAVAELHVTMQAGRCSWNYYHY